MVYSSALEKRHAFGHREFESHFLRLILLIWYNYLMTLRQSSILLSRISLFVIYFWFGILKVIGLSPASLMVTELFEKTLAHVPIISSMPVNLFVILFGIFEVVIALLFIIPGFERLGIIAFSVHMLTTTLPLFFLHQSVWQGMFVPTLEGQYIIKNLVIIALAFSLAHHRPQQDNPK